jgi:hypothetical protein
MRYAHSLDFFLPSFLSLKARTYYQAKKEPTLVLRWGVLEMMGMYKEVEIIRRPSKSKNVRRSLDIRRPLFDFIF